MSPKTEQKPKKSLGRLAKEAALDSLIELPGEDTTFNVRFDALLEKLAEKYEAWSLEELDTALSEMRSELREVEATIRGADDALNEAAEKDAIEYATAGDLASVEAPHFAKAQKAATGAVIKAWSLNRAIVEADLAWRVKRTAELDAEIIKVGGMIPNLEEKTRKAQDALNEARWYHTDLVNEARDVRVNKRHFGEFARYAQGPNLGGWLNFLMRSR